MSLRKIDLIIIKENSRLCGKKESITTSNFQLAVLSTNILEKKLSKTLQNNAGTKI
jgi:hypothetical protein